MNEQQDSRELVIGSPEHSASMRAWETEMRLMPSRERERRFEIGRTEPDIISEPKGQVDADVGFQGPQPK